MRPLLVSTIAIFLLLLHCKGVNAAPILESFGTLQRGKSRIPITELAEQGEITIVLLPSDPSARIGLAAVLSRYIGESEKNLDRLMELAVSTGTVLLFDEANALYDNSSQVWLTRGESAHQDVSYLLIPISAMHEGATPDDAGKLGRSFWALPDACDLWTTYDITPITGAILLLDQDGKAVNVGTVADMVKIASAINQSPHNTASTKKAHDD